MTVDLPCILYSRDPDLQRRLCGYLHERATVRTVTDKAALLLALRQQAAVLVFADLRAPDCTALLAAIQADFPTALVVALGDARTDPGLAAAAGGVFAVESLTANRIRIQSLADQVRLCLQVRAENRVLRAQASQPPAQAPPPRESITASLSHFANALRRFDNLEQMLQSMAEGVAGCARVSRVAVFALTDADLYRFRAGVKCLEQTRELAFDRSHAFVQWLQLHAHSVTRSMLRHVEAIQERILLETGLDLHGADVILPLFGRDRLLGWLSLGRPASGVPFEPRDIDELSLLGEQVSVAIENALLHDNIAMQKTLAENLLQAIPVGIVASGADGTVRWFNSGAEKLLGAAALDLIGQPVERLPGFLASMLNRCTAGESAIGPIAWTEPLSRRDLTIQSRRLVQHGQCMGAMAVLKDTTEDRLLREKQVNIERARFWNELTRAISHEIRNPLVAISTFAQLLPERYNDEEFRTQFRDLTVLEVERLNGMIDQLDKFATPPTIRLASVDVSTLFNTAICKIRRDETARPTVRTRTEDDLPLLRADNDVLADALAHLLDNAVRAVEDRPDPRIELRAHRIGIGTDRTAVQIEVRDNGCGIPDEVMDQVFSPFYTTKTSGIGLGLPIVRRTLIDHEGLIAIDSGPHGTVVQLTVPAADNRGTHAYETVADCRR